MVARGYLYPDPVAVHRLYWPQDRLADYQEQILWSLWDNPETVMTAGNELGKDYIAAKGIWIFLLTRHPWRGLATSANERHLSVLWGELGKAKASARRPMDWRDGGPFKMDSEKITRVNARDPSKLCEVCYFKKMVAGPDSLDAMAGHHVPEVDEGAGFECCGELIDWPMPRTLFVGDEASSLNDEFVRRASGWYKRLLLFGNPWTCDNYFRRAVEGNGTTDPGGDLYWDRNRPERGLIRKVFCLSAEDSPNIRYARAEQACGMDPTGRMVIAGLKSWEKYQRDLATMDEVQRCVQLQGRFYKGGQAYLFPPDWLAHSEQLAFDLHGGATDSKGKKRVAKAMGIDPAEGGDDCVWTVVDEHGALEQVSYKTPDTNVIPNQTMALIRQWSLDPGQVVFDRGGGGKQHADRMRAKGFPVRAITFGRPKGQSEAKYGKRFPDESFEETELADVYSSRRCEMYDRLSRRMNPNGVQGGFAIPRQLAELRRQLAFFPRIYVDGKLYLPPKTRKPGQKLHTEKTLVELIGNSPDEADSLALAVWAMENPAHVVTVG